jgi:hypothetical protein
MCIDMNTGQIGGKIRLSAAWQTAMPCSLDSARPLNSNVEMGVLADGQAIGKWWLVWEFGDDTMADKKACIDAYLRHNAHIKATVPAERLLVWEARDGWEPLCRWVRPLLAPRLVLTDYHMTKTAPLLPNSSFSA